MQRTYDTPGPVELTVELGGGRLSVRAEEVATTTVTVDGPEADQVSIDRHGDRISVIAPRQRAGFLRTPPDLQVTAVVPHGSDLAGKLGSADLVATGRYGGVRLRSASGEIRVEETTGEAVLESGSGDVEVERCAAARVKAGSGDVVLGSVTGECSVATGSGEVRIGSCEGEVRVKSGSGDVRVVDARADLSLATASGDVNVGAFHRGRLQAKGVSGDVRVGIPAGVPVWTDVSCLSGRIHSTLEGAGQPEEGQDYIELRATTVSGDIHLDQL